jgi:glycine betaine transporter
VGKSSRRILAKNIYLGASAAFGFTTDSFGWFYLTSVLLFVVFLVYLVFSKYGKIRLGADDSRPEYHFFTWVGMLFSAGFRVGLVFWGITKPMSHFFTTPIPTYEAQTEEAARLAMAYSFFHWGVSQWSVFAVVGLIIAYFQFRKKENGLISTSLSSIIGETKHTSKIKKTIDILAVIATVMGVATSLGLGILQINGGLSSEFGLSDGVGTQLIIVLVLLILYLTSSTTGLNKGIKWLSNLNLSLALLLMVFVFIAAIAAVLLIASGLEGLQTASLVSALPFTITLILMCYTLFRLLRKEVTVKRKKKKKE